MRPHHFRAIVTGSPPRRAGVGHAGLFTPRVLDFLIVHASEEAYTSGRGNHLMTTQAHPSSNARREQMFDMKDLRNISADDLLGLIGVQRRRSTSSWLWPALGLFGAGLLAGAGVGLLLTPKSGRQFRQTLRTRFQRNGPSSMPASPA
jgi:hypothetical protein